MNSLILQSAKLVGRAAVGSFGWQVGRDAHRNFLSILGYVAIVLIGIGGIILPIMAARKIVQWHPGSWGAYFVRVLVPWVLLGALGVVLIIPLAFVFEQVTRIGYPNPLKEMVAVATLLFAGAFTLTGTIWGLSERGERKRSYAILQANEAFLSEHGLREVDGSAVTHLDGNGRRLRLGAIFEQHLEVSPCALVTFDIAS